MAPRTKKARLTGLTTIHKDKPAGNPRDALHKTKKHSSVSLIAHVIHLVHAPASCSLAIYPRPLPWPPNAQRRKLAYTSQYRPTCSAAADETESEPDKKQGDDEGWVSSDEDDELDEDEILVLQTQRAQRNAREAEKLKAAAKQLKPRFSPNNERTKIANNRRLTGNPDMPALPVESPSSLPRGKPSLPAKQLPTEAKPQLPPAAPNSLKPKLLVNHSQSHHTEQSALIQNLPARPGPYETPPSRAKQVLLPHISLLLAMDRDIRTLTLIPQANGTHDKAPPHDHPSDHHHQRPDDRPNTRRSHSHMIKPAVPTPGRSHTLAAPARPHPLIRAPSVLTKVIPALSPLKAPPYLSAHSAKAQISSSPPPGTPSTSSPPHTRQPSLSSSTHTLPTLQVSPTAALTTSVSSLPHSPHSSPTTSFKPIPERERTVSAVSSAAALHAIHNHNPHRKPHRSLGAVATSTFPPEPADTYNGGMYPGSGSSLAAPGGTSAVVGASGGCTVENRAQCIRYCLHRIWPHT
ncbi:hypothetical protein RhiXN_10458 [Rhizoctonia solani]|uniref:Uncharacterized protein n=1 Tax=Rhizoctonia solani TaxID=456999 RepID=A0A8H8SZZ3_9AGAM|nr:uncharacterized protein RhiXN_10458 [Rhizoctonia solani]QRW24134.1 hypothetical protein RhiXN_10458 [Rhizoctonia solani]